MSCPSCRAENRPGARGCRRCRKALPTLGPGDVVAGRFEILSLLGTGGMGVVFRARDRSLDEIVALKTLRTDLDAPEEMASRFRSEIRLARMVSSRHVCRIHEYGVDGDLHHISMEYVEGVTLKDLLHECGGLPADVAVDVVTQIVAGLTAIHDAGIMHRDVKPSNLMRTRTGLVKLMDFGIAKQVGGATLTAAGQAVGTPEYMSPEQVTGRKLDVRTDIYTTGIVTFELLTGISPFRADSPIDSAHKQVTEVPDFLTDGIPLPLVPVLGRALAKDRDARYASARELGEALAAVRAEVGLATAAQASDTGRWPPPASAAPAPAEPPTGRRSTAQSQAMAPPPVTAVIAVLHGTDAVARRRAVLTLAEIGPRSPTAVRALADALRDADDRVRFMAAAALGRIGPAAESAVPALLAALDDEAASTEAAESLVKIGKAAVPALLEVMQSGPESTRWHAATALTRIGAAGAPSRPRP
ncbi:MAG TPA: protein kinase [Vicinamibacteria bacterium]